MPQTSKRLHNVKKESLSKSVRKLDVTGDDEILLLNAPSEYDDMYRSLGVNSKQSVVAEQLKDSKEIEVFQKKYGNLEAFKGHHIKELCNKYDLMLLPISDLRGYLDDNTMKQLKEFNTKFDKTIMSDSYIYILAARECFYSEFKGKPVKTFIIFYKEKTGEYDSYSKVRKKDTVNQICSSGTDFDKLRVFNQLFLKRRYQGGDGMPRLWGNVTISLLLLVSIIWVSFGFFITGTVFMTLYLIVMAFYNSGVEEYENCWNEYSGKRGNSVHPY